MSFPLLKHINKVRALQFFQVFRFGVLLLISIIFTKTKLGVGEIGVYETFLLIAGSVSFFWIGGMLQSLLSIAGNSNTFGKTERNPIFFNVFVLFSLISLLSAFLVLISQSFISGLFSIAGGKIPYMKILFMYIAVSGPVNLAEYFYLLKNKPIHLIVYGVVTFSLQLVCVALPVVLGFDLGYGLYGLVFVNGLRFLWLSGMVYKYSELKFSKTFLKEFFVLSGPLVLSMLLSGSAQYIDGFLVSFKFDEATLAIFRYGARELPFFVLLLDAFGNAITPMFSKSEKQTIALTELRIGTARLMNWIFPSSIVLVLTSKFLFPIIFNTNFQDSSIVFNIYLLIIITRFLFTRIILIGLKNTKPIFWSSLIEIILNVLLSIAFIHIWGIAGVAIATVISYLVEKLYLVFYLKHKYSIYPSTYLNVKLYTFWSILLISAFLVSLFF